MVNVVNAKIFVEHAPCNIHKILPDLAAAKLIDAVEIDSWRSGDSFFGNAKLTGAREQVVDAVRSLNKRWNMGVTYSIDNGAAETLARRLRPPMSQKAKFQLSAAAGAGIAVCAGISLAPE